mgnify:FL=1
MQKTTRLRVSAILTIIIALVVAFVFIISDWLSARVEIKLQPNYDGDVIQINGNTSIYNDIMSQFDSLEVDEDEQTRIVSSIFRMYGNSIDDIQYTGTGNDNEVVITGLTTLNKETDKGSVELAFDFGEFIEYINASSNVYCDVNGNLVGTVTFDGQDYDVQEVLVAMSNGNVQECWFWLVIKIVVVIVNVVVAAISAYDIFKYLTSEEVTFNGVLCIVGEGILMSATSFVGGAIAGSLIKSGVKTIKKGKKISKNASALLGRKADKLLDESVKVVKSGKRNNGLTFTNDSNLRKAYSQRKEFSKYNFTDKSKDNYIEIHHFVEQRQSGVKFKAQDIHTDLNSVGIPKSLHTKISALYSSSKKYNKELEEIFGKGYFDGKTTFREFVGQKTYEEQYEIGMKVFKYFNKQGNYVKLFL